MKKNRTTAVQIVDGAIADYITSLKGRGIDPKGFNVGTLAAIAGVSRARMSHFLQVHRVAQGRGKTVYVVACGGIDGFPSYGPDARWAILAKPSSDPRVLREARQKAAIHSADDAVARFLKDQNLEINSSLSGTQSDTVIEAAVETMALTLRGQADFIRKVIEGTPA